MAQTKFIRFAIGNDPVLCAGCRRARPYGPRENPFWHCEVYDRPIGGDDGRPTRCPECIGDELVSDADLQGGAPQRTPLESHDADRVNPDRPTHFA